MEGDWGEFDHFAFDVVAMVIGLVVGLIGVIVGEGEETGGAEILLVLGLVDLHLYYKELNEYINSLIKLTSKRRDIF